jgi:hypothetical protein
MRLRLRNISLSTALAVGICACGAAIGAEPTEAQMKEAALYAMNHPPGETVPAPITIAFFKKEACDNPSPLGYNCLFDIKVASTNIGASVYNNMPGAWFYQDKESGKWAMRLPF